MSTVPFTTRIDENLKQQAFGVFEEYGLTAAQAVKMFFAQVAKTHSIPLSLNYQATEPNEETKQAMLAADKGLNDCYEVNSAEELVKVMEKIYNE